jgi:hypothetical protein
MSLETEITVDGDVEAVLSLDRQIQFAAVTTATDLAKQSQAAAIDAIRETFNTTNPWYLPTNFYGVHFAPATLDNPTSQVKSNAYWLVPHEIGGLKTPHEGDFLAIPTEAIQPDRSHPVPRDKRPAALADAFILPTRRGPKLFERINNQLRVVYNLVRSVRIQKHSTIVEPTIRTVETKLAPTFTAKLLEALRTAK